MDGKHDETNKRGPQRIERRTTIKGLGALAISANALSLVGCSEDSGSGTPTGDMTNPQVTPPTLDTLDTNPAQTGAPATPSGQTPTSNASPMLTPSPNPGESMGAAGQGGPMMPPGDDPASPMGPGSPSQEPPGPAVETTPPEPMMPPSQAMPSAPEFEEVNSCELTPVDPAREGPFFIHEDEVMNDVNLFRQDLRDGHEGVEMRLNLRMLESSDGCMTPIEGVEVYVWHTDALGFYSGFDGQNPDEPYAGCFECTPANDDRFCRGAQITDENGVASFTTLYPGWYNGRPIHIHFLSLRPGSGPDTMSYRGEQYAVLTTQMYFEADFSRTILEGYAPYDTRASGQGYERSLTPGTDVRPTTRMEGDVVVASLNIVTRSDEARGTPGSGGFGGLFGP